MASFAPVVPVWLARKLDELDLLGGYHLLLAHDVAANVGAYAEVYSSKLRSKHSGTYIIMDNSLIELGTPVDDQTMYTAMRCTRANACVLPDYPHDCLRTIDASVDAHKRWTKMDFINFMCVAQGNTLDEYVTCAATLLKLPGVRCVGIPRNIVSKLNTRFFVLQAIWEVVKGWGVDIHLLGFSEDVLDDITCASLPFVRGIDSAVPIRAGLENCWLTSPFEYATFDKPRGDYWTNERPVTPALIQNLQRVRAWLQIHT